MMTTRIGACIAAGAVVLGAAAVTIRGAGGAAAGDATGMFTFEVATPNGGNATFDAVKAALKDSLFNATAIKSGLDTSTRPPTVTSFEVSTHPAFVFDVERLLRNDVTAGQTVNFVAPPALALADLDGTAGIVGPDDLAGPDDVVGPDEYTIAVEAWSTDSIATLGVLHGAAGDDVYVDQRSVDPAVYTQTYLWITNPAGSGGANTFPPGSIGVKAAGGRQVVLRHHAPLVVPQGESRGYWITAAFDLLDGRGSYEWGAKMGSLTTRKLVLGTSTGDGSRMYLFPRNAPGGLKAATIEMGSGITYDGLTADVCDDEEYAGGCQTSTMFKRYCIDVKITNAYRKTATGYELISSTPITAAAFFDQDIAPGTTLYLAKSASYHGDNGNTYQGVQLDNQGMALLGIFDN